jgi:hypothetical protein
MVDSVVLSINGLFRDEIVAYPLKVCFDRKVAAHFCDKDMLEKCDK